MAIEFFLFMQIISIGTKPRILRLFCVNYWRWATSRHGHQRQILFPEVYPYQVYECVVGLITGTALLLCVTLSVFPRSVRTWDRAWWFDAFPQAMHSICTSMHFRCTRIALNLKSEVFQFVWLPFVFFFQQHWIQFTSDSAAKPHRSITKEGNYKGLKKIQ